MTRRDVLYELAGAAGLDVARFAGALAAPATERRVLESFEDALEKGIERRARARHRRRVARRRAAERGRSTAAVLRRYAAARLGLPLLRTVH